MFLFEFAPYVDVPDTIGVLLAASVVAVVFVGYLHALFDSSTGRYK